jgi:hypothetical protein
MARMGWPAGAWTNVAVRAAPDLVTDSLSAPSLVDYRHTRGLFRCHPNSKFFYSLFITLIFNRLYGVLNVGKKIINYTV